jgi:hypothetical protein
MKITAVFNKQETNIVDTKPTKVYIVTKQLEKTGPPIGTIFTIINLSPTLDNFVLYLYSSHWKYYHLGGWDRLDTLENPCEYKEITEDFDLQFRF